MPHPAYLKRRFVLLELFELSFHVVVMAGLALFIHPLQLLSFFLRLHRFTSLIGFKFFPKSQVRRYIRDEFGIPLATGIVTLATLNVLKTASAPTSPDLNEGIRNTIEDFAANLI